VTSIDEEEAYVLVNSTIKANIYDMARSHEGRDDKQHIVRGNTSLYQIS
jgi:hypothetical protein